MGVRASVRHSLKMKCLEGAAQEGFVPFIKTIAVDLVSGDVIGCSPFRNSRSEIPKPSLNWLG